MKTIDVQFAGLTVTMTPIADPTRQAEVVAAIGEALYEEHRRLGIEALASDDGVAYTLREREALLAAVKRVERRFNESEAASNV